jgi:hypothetical protein
MFLTFDDGLREMYEIVAPILLAKGIPAAFFLNTDYLDNKALMFRYHASLLIQEGIESHQNRRYLLQARNQAALDRLIPSDSMLDIAAYLSSQQPYMTSTQVQWLVDQGFAIGAHSCSHPYYSDLPLAQQLAETHQCLHILRDKFNITDRLFAFPFTDAGVQQLFFDQAFSSSQLDYTFGSAGMKRDTGPRQLQRMPMEAGNATAEQLVKSEYLYYLLRMPFFRNQIQRS